MTGLDELIAYHERRASEASAEIGRISNLPEGKHTTHAEHDKWIAGWEKDRRYARDTVSYLKTIQQNMNYLKMAEEARVHMTDIIKGRSDQ